MSAPSFFLRREDVAYSTTQRLTAAEVAALKLTLAPEAKHGSHATTATTPAVPAAHRLILLTPAVRSQKRAQATDHELLEALVSMVLSEREITRQHLALFGGDAFTQGGANAAESIARANARQWLLSLAFRLQDEGFQFGVVEDTALMQSFYDQR